MRPWYANRCWYQTYLRKKQPFASGAANSPFVRSAAFGSTCKERMPHLRPFKTVVRSAANGCFQELGPRSCTANMGPQSSHFLAGVAISPTAVPLPYRAA